MKESEPQDFLATLLDIANMSIGSKYDHIALAVVSFLTYDCDKSFFIKVKVKNA